MSFAILRTAKLKTPRDLTVASCHNGRQLEPSNADPSRSHLNQHSHDSSPIVDRWQKRIDEAGIKKVRKNAVHGIEVFLGYSPEAKINPEQWRRATQNWLTETFGEDNILQLDLHLDETTPHVQAIIVPITEDGRLTAKEWLGGREKLSDMQDSFARATEEFGLKRGTKGSSRKHTPIAKYHGILAAHVFEPAPQLPLPPLMGRETWQNQQQEKIEELALAAGTAVSQATMAKQIAAEERKIATNAKTRTKALALKLDIEKNRRKEEAAKLKSIPLEAVLKSHGYSPNEKSGSETVYDTQSGKISINNSLWSLDWETGGRGAIDLEIELGGGNVRDAISRLKTTFGEDLTSQTYSQWQSLTAQKRVKETPAAPKADLQKNYYKEDPSKWEIVLDYLRKRKIPEAIIEKQRSLGKLWANAWGSVCCGCKTKNGTLKAVHVRGTETGFKASYGDKATPWVCNGSKGKDGQYAVVESPIDAMSLTAMTDLNTFTHGGTICPKHRPDFIAFDNDAAGLKAAKKLQITYPAAKIIAPAGAKDWSDALISGDMEIKEIGPEPEGPSI